jgi:hypothetical protein
MRQLLPAFAASDLADRSMAVDVLVREEPDEDEEEEEEEDDDEGGEDDDNSDGYSE